MATCSVGVSLDFEAIMRACNLHQNTDYSSLKEKQKEALSACSRGDVTCILPTGYGKTVVIHLLPFLRPENEHPASVLVVAPLNAILQEQQRRFGDSGLVIDDELLIDLEEDKVTEATVRLKTGKFNFLLGHPEKFVNPLVRRILMTEQVSSKVTHIVVDEAHCILSWGKSLFRSAFLELSCLRASLPAAKMLALTATANDKAQAEIGEALHMRQPILVKASADRPSVYICVKRRPPTSGGNFTVTDSYEDSIDPLLNELREQEGSFPKTIVYLPLKWCGYSHERAIGFLKDLSTFQPMLAEGDDEVKSFVAQYHAPQTALMKQLISKTMQIPNGPLRLLFATEAYGMGADSPNVRRVVHVGPPSNLETYIQEVGRAGRDGEPAEAILYYNNADLGNNRKHLTDAMRQFCRLTSCRREFLMDYFGCELTVTDRARCCDVCSGSPPKDSTPVKSLKPIPHISETLQGYFEAENSLVTRNCMPEISTGLSVQLADRISSQPLRYIEGSHLAEDFPFLLPLHIETIKELLIEDEDNEE